MTGERAGTDEPNPWPRPTSGPQGLGQVERRSSTRARSSQRAIGIAAGALFTLLISGLVYLVVETADGNETVASETAPSSEGSDGSAASEGTAPDGQAAATDATTTASEAVATTLPDGAYVLATLDEADFVVSGLVPSAEIEAGLIQAAEIAYAPFARSELVVGEELPPAEFLASSPAAISLLAMTTQGSLLIADGQVTVSGQLPSQVAADRLEAALAEATGLPVTLQNIEITNLQPPRMTMANLDGTLVIGGRVPDQQIRDDLIAGAVASYGADQVTDELKVDETVHSSLWMYTGAELFQATTVFPEFDIQIDGSSMTGLVRGGYTFEPGSDQVTPTYAEVLEFGIGVMVRDQSLQLVIEAHTDGDGDDDYNLELSQRRAEAVAAFFTDAGIDPERITAVGKGESEPIAPNDDEDGRARNRRIDVVLSAVPL